MVLPIVFVPFIIRFPAGLVLYWVTTNLWTVGQGLITRRLIPKPAAPPKRSSRNAPREAPAPALVEDGDGDGQAGRGGPAEADGSAGGSPARQAQEEANATMSEDGPIVVESEGETVGEAKWVGLRDLERRFPGLDREPRPVRGHLRGRAGPARRRDVPCAGPRPFRPRRAAGACGAGRRRRERHGGARPRAARGDRPCARRGLPGRRRRRGETISANVTRPRRGRADRQARQDDRLDPVSRRRRGGVSRRRSSAARRRGRGRLSEPARVAARPARGALGVPGAARRPRPCTSSR